MPNEEYLDEDSEWAGSEGWAGPGWYAVDVNGIVAGVFDDDGEAAWWLNKAVRV